MKSKTAVAQSQLSPSSSPEISISGYSLEASAVLVSLKEDLTRALNRTPRGNIADQMVICRAILERLDLGFSDSSKLTRSMLDLASLAALAKRADAPTTLGAEEFNCSSWYRKDLVDCLDQIVHTGLDPSKSGSYNRYKTSIRSLIAGIEQYL